MNSDELSRQLRKGSGDGLRRRRRVVALQLLGVGAMAPIVLYQMGLIDHLPEPPLPKLDADAVDASGEAYALLATPDAVLGIGGYALTMPWRRWGARSGARSGPGCRWPLRPRSPSTPPLPPS